MSPFTDKVAVVTGAGSGIGRALALALADRGARLAVSDRDPDALRGTADALAARGAQVHAEVLDVTDREAWTAYAAAVVRTFGVVHQLYGNAGIAGGSTTIEATDHEVFERVLDVNLWGVIHGTKALLPHIIASGDGHVVNVSSLNGIMAQPRLGPYVTSKFAVRGFTETLRTEMIAGGHPVAVTVVHPGGVKTGIASAAAQGATSEADRKRLEAYEAKLFRTTPEEAARIILDGVARRRGRIRIGQAVSIDRIVRLLPERYPRIVVAWSRKTFGE